ncbi:MAG: hypothetical protein WBQ65_05840 [Bryobacteraceae bacterium]
MPRVRRRGNALRFSGAMLEALVLGDGDFTDGGPGFASATEERAAWIAHRNALMAEYSGPGRRPFAFYRHDLGAEPRHWFDEIRVLLEHGLLDATEALLCEKLHHVLSDNAAVYSSFESAALIRAMGLSPSVLLHCQKEFELASTWHTWRGRPELGARYGLRVEAVRDVLRDAP